jgi:hypothetical protein
MTVWPTAVISDEPGANKPAISSLSPRATAAPISPANAPTQPGMRLCSRISIVAALVVMSLSCSESLPAA